MKASETLTGAAADPDRVAGQVPPSARPCSGDPAADDDSPAEPGPENVSGVRGQLLGAAGKLLARAEAAMSVPLAGNDDEIRQDLNQILVAAQRFSEMTKEVAAHLDDSSPPVERRDDPNRRIRHDLRTPLNAVVGFAEMLIEDDADLDVALLLDVDGVLIEARVLLARIQEWFPPRPGGSPVVSSLADMGAFSRSARLGNRVQPAKAWAGDPGHILVTDDNEANRQVLSRRLERDGHRVTEAVNGDDALEMLHQGSFDLLLLDLIMPDWDGFEVLKTIKGDPKLHDMPVIMISALDETDSVIRCIEAGAEDYLTKPFDPVLLRARINAALTRRFWHKREKEHLDRLKSEQAKSEALLLNILPEQIVGRLGGDNSLIADHVEAVTVLFSDVVGFTKIAARTAPEVLLRDLNTIFSRFDRLSQDLGVEKIKTIGDAYMAVAGVPSPRPDHAEAAAEMALRMMEAMEAVTPELTCPFEIRIGMHTGPVAAGVIGSHKFAYDVWGDTVNYASRMESASMPNLIQVSEATHRALAGSYEFLPGGGIRVKGKGRVATYFLTGRKAGKRDSSPRP